jgi:hypothetical protein
VDRSALGLNLRSGLDAEQAVIAFNLTPTLGRSNTKRHSICRTLLVRAKMPPAVRINAAIRACLDTLGPGRPPLAHLATFLHSLRQDPKFSDADIREVEATVRRILSELIAEPEE